MNFKLIIDVAEALKKALLPVAANALTNMVGDPAAQAAAVHVINGAINSTHSADIVGAIVSDLSKGHIQASFNTVDVKAAALAYSENVDFSALTPQDIAKHSFAAGADFAAAHAAFSLQAQSKDAANAQTPAETIISNVVHVAEGAATGGTAGAVVAAAAEIAHDVSAVVSPATKDAWQPNDAQPDDAAQPKSDHE